MGVAAATGSVSWKNRSLMAPGEERHGDDHAEQAAMERHAAVPDSEDLQGMLEILGEVVEQDVAEPSAEHDAEHGPDDEIVEQVRRQRALAAGGEAAGVAPADQMPTT